MRAAGVVLVLAVAAAALTACSHDTGSAPPTSSASSPSSSSAPAATSSAPAATSSAPAVTSSAPTGGVAPVGETSTAPSSAGSAAGSTPPCSSSTTTSATELTQSLMGNRAIELHVTATQRCITTGYPGVAVLDDSGRQVLQVPRQPSGYFGGLAGGNSTPPTIVLEPGQEATALVEYANVDHYDGQPCQQYPGLLVTLPDTTTSTRLDIAFTTCLSTVSVNPLVAGDLGRE